MKKYVIAAGICLVALTTFAQLQQAGNELAGGLRNHGNNNQYLNEMNTRAMRDFVSRFSGVTNELWHRNNDCYVAVFFRDSVQYRVIYTSRGDLNYVMKYYEEKKLARDIRAQVKSVYYDYKIYIVQEIESPDNPTVYIFNLQGDTDWKKVKLRSGEMEVLEEYRKGK